MAMATLAGGGVAIALRLGASMLALQASIGALNDLVDAGVDSGRKPGKPIPRGAVRPTEAAVVALGGLLAGLALSAMSGPGTAAVAAVGVGLGYAYDLRLSRTAWSWLPLAAALPLVPVHAWIGTTGAVPSQLLPLVPIGILAGAGLALGNGIADLERDRAAGVATAALRLGRAAWPVHAVALGAVLAMAWALAPGSSATPAPRASLRTAAMGLGSVLVALGIVLARARRPGLRERGWELEASGVGLLGLAWVSEITPL
jgi:4-hydroxybenzoate polyprenyltransferase